MGQSFLGTCCAVDIPPVASSAHFGRVPNVCIGKNNYEDHENSPEPYLLAISADVGLALKRLQELLPP